MAELAAHGSSPLSPNFNTVTNIFKMNIKLKETENLEAEIWPFCHF